MNDPSCRKMVSAGDTGLASRASSDATAFLPELWARSIMNGTIHASASHKRIVGGVNDGIDLERGDIGQQYGYLI
jgi:hypothetical protein